MRYAYLMLAKARSGEPSNLGNVHAFRISNPQEKDVFSPVTSTKRALLRPFLWRWCVLAALAAGASAAWGADLAAASAPPTNRVLRLSADRYAGGVDINASGQVVFTEQVGGFSRARLYDGHAVRDLGTLGGPSASTRALNDLGQVIGQSDLDRNGTLVHAYRWTPGRGMLDIDAGARTGSTASDINARGDVAGAGYAGVAGGVQYRGYFWRPEAGKVSVGAFGNSSIPTALNDYGTVAGYAEGPEGGPRSILAFRWTMRDGISDIGTMPDEFTWATDVNNAGQIVGATPFAPDERTHAFVWTPRQGLRDLGVGTGERSSAVKINQDGAVIGYTLRFGTLFHGFVWTRSGGLFEFGADQPTVTTDALDVNRAGHVVGLFGGRAFLWTGGTSTIDLNTRLTGAPPGLVLTSGIAISDNGAIVAGADSGLYLLTPNR
jgi:probable HAF family extracellular repeat protein